MYKANLRSRWKTHRQTVISKPGPMCEMTIKTRHITCAQECFKALVSHEFDFDDIHIVVRCSQW